jgi:hypothetical protein
MTKDMVLYIFDFLPIISILAMLRAYPHIRKKGWMTAGKIIDNIYTQLQQKIHPDIYSPHLVYTGAQLAEIILKEKFPRVIETTKVLSLFPDWKPVRATNGNVKRYHNAQHDMSVEMDLLENLYDLHTHRWALNGDCMEIMICENSYDEKVKSFDCSVFQFYVSREKLVIVNPQNLLKKNTIFYVDRLINKFYNADREHPFESILAIQLTRLNIYLNDGFNINIVHTLKTEDDFRVHFKNIPNDRITPSWNKWKEIRPPEGIWENK